MATTIPLKELRNNVSDVLRRAEAGEQFTITVSGRPVARLQADGNDPWTPVASLHDLWALPADRDLAADLESAGFDYGLRDPWAGRE